MKKIVLAGLVAVSMLAITQQQASAWVNSRFGIGLNWNFQSGGNQILWGAWRNGQVPGPEAYDSHGHGHHSNGGGMQQFYAPPPQGYYGGAPMPQPYAPQGSFSPTMEPPIARQQYQPLYQFANYPRQSFYPSYYYYYPTPYYYYGQ